MRLKAFSILLLLAGQVAATPVTWTLDNVVFSDGYGLSGSFAYDADTNIYSDISIQGGLITPVTYTGENPTYADVWNSYYASPPPSLPDVQTPLTNVSDTGVTLAAGYQSFGNIQQTELTLVFGVALTNVGGTVALAPTVSNERLYVDVVQDYYDSRTLVRGVITAVPIPAAAWLFGSALAGLGWIRRRQAA